MYLFIHPSSFLRAIEVLIWLLHLYCFLFRYISFCFLIEWDVFFHRSKSKISLNPSSYGFCAFGSMGEMWMLQITLGKRHYTGVRCGELLKWQSFCFKRVLALILLTCMDIRFKMEYWLVPKKMLHFYYFFKFVYLLPSSYFVVRWDIFLDGVVVLSICYYYFC